MIHLSDSYRYNSADCSHAHDYLLPTVRSELASLWAGGARRLFDLGCGNGSVAASLARDGWDVSGVDPSKEGIAEALRAYPGLKLRNGSAYDDLDTAWGSFPAVISH